MFKQVIFTAFSAVVFVFPIPINAQTIEPSFPGIAEGIGTHFEITDSEYINATLNSSEEIDLRMESMPEIITMMIESVSSSTPSSQITISGFEPLTAYYKYQDNYHNLASFITDENGSYSYTQDLSESHFVFIQPRASTKFIKDDATGGDCSSIGNWDIAAKTCVLTVDVNETIQIDDGGITLDGDGYTITGNSTGYGVYLPPTTDVTVKNLNITNFSFGIFILASRNYNNNARNIIIGNTISNNNRGINLRFSSNSIISKNLISNNDIGILVDFYSENTIVTDNTFLNSGLRFSFSPNNKIYHNNFLNSSTFVYGEFNNLFDNGLSDGGNYWSDFDELAEGCDDANSDGFCDLPYVFDGGQDNYPWISQDGWKLAQKEVPLYTQIRSPYPSIQETESWYDLDYAAGIVGNYACGSKIYQCGCAITSSVMIARYYDITEAQERDVNPGEINEWLKNEPGGYVNGDVNWIAAAKYTDYGIRYEKTDKTTNNYTLLDEYLNKNQPVIAKANAGRGNINSQHFFVIDKKLVSTYGVKDPAWYNTSVLNEGASDSVNYIRDYENGFDGLRIYKKGNGLAQSAITIALGSPAELLITDYQGRKLGKDENNIEYSEIPEAWYFEDGFDDPFGQTSLSQERNKLIQILEPVDGEYQLQVIGTGEGDYTLQSSFYDVQGGINSQEFQSETAPDYIAKYDLLFNSSNSASTTIKLFDEIPPEAEIFFNLDTQELEIKGIDNTTVNPIVSIVEKNKEIIYQIEDEVGNTTKLYFEKIKQKGKEIKAKLEVIQYNDEEIIELEADFKYEWSLDKHTGEIKNLEQKLEVKNQFKIKAKYNHKKDETKIKIKLPDQEEQKQTLSGIVIIKLITKSGVLGFDY